jgi:hypothetical protein
MCSWNSSHQLGSLLCTTKLELRGHHKALRDHVGDLSNGIGISIGLRVCICIRIRHLWSWRKVHWDLHASLCFCVCQEHESWMERGEHA